MLVSLGLLSYEYIVRTLLAREFIISVEGAFIMISLIKELGSERYELSTCLNSSSSSFVGRTPKRSKNVISSKPKRLSLTKPFTRSSILYPL